MKRVSARYVGIFVVVLLVISSAESSDFYQNAAGTNQSTGISQN